MKGRLTAFTAISLILLTSCGQRDTAVEPIAKNENCMPLEYADQFSVEYLDGGWKMHRQKFSGWSAQIILHEMDHLDGILI